MKKEKRKDYLENHKKDSDFVWVRKYFKLPNGVLLEVRYPHYFYKEEDSKTDVIKKFNMVIDREIRCASTSRKNKNLKNGSKKRMIMTI
ncbi:hypothetical protein [Clostridium sp. MD294]|uniref:hypothetical protein n=1 Tax=Clostridium sp. MD294 TaxID=97138 RepID=UPI0002CA6164|nr:hypothetical protein [Clostridium sp. MD294]NDO47017.1 hypothetical protein [Clostridium sp. MD294]USF31224.1 hypothetical protein C820_002670 [Clostridium sp. MD294]